MDIQLENLRPQHNEETYLSATASYTSINGGIDGLFLNKGIVIKDQINPLLTGFYIIANDSIMITDLKIKELTTSVSCAFQQTLLINESELVECSLFRNTESFRGALIKFDGMVAIGESHRPITIKEF